jgi:hypothetical protein
VPDNVNCSCDEHKGVELINKKFNLSLEKMMNCIFEDSEFNRKFMVYRKLSNVVINQFVNNKRTVEYTINLTGFGSVKTIEWQVRLTYIKLLIRV